MSNSRTARAFCGLALIALSGFQMRAQTAGVKNLYARMDLLYEHGEAETQQQVLDSVLAGSSHSPDEVRLAHVFAARLMRNSGRARAGLTILDSLVKDTAKAEPLVRFACLDERARELKQIGRLPRAEIEAGEALIIARTGRLPRQEISALILNAEIAGKLARTDNALSLLLEAEMLEAAVGYPLARCNVILNRGNILYRQGRYEEALIRFQEAGECGLSGGFRPLVMNALFNEGSALSQMDDDSIAPAIAMYERALEDPYVKQDRRHEADLFGAIGMLRKFEGQYDLALTATERAVAIRRELNDTLSQAQDLITLASIHRETARFDLGLDAAMQGLALSRSNNATEEELNALMEVSKNLRELGRHQDANDQLDRFIELEGTIAERADVERTVDMEFKYGLEKKEALIASEKAKTRRREIQLLASAIIAVLLIVLLALVVRNVQHLRKGQAQTRLLHERQVNELLKQQEIRSFDSMMLGQEKERTRVAKDLHDRVGTVLSMVRLRFSALQGRIEQLGARMQQDDPAFKLLDEAVVEVRRISHDMVRGSLSKFGLTVALQDLCETLRVPDKMEVELGVHGLDQRLEGKMEVAVYRMVQEAVGNALKHAKASELSIQVNRAPASLNVMVEDNGIGFDPGRAGEGMGMGNLRERASALSGVVNVDSRAGHGTTVTIDIPLSTPTTT